MKARPPGPLLLGALWGASESLMLWRGAEAAPLSPLEWALLALLPAALGGVALGLGAALVTRVDRWEATLRRVGWLVGLAIGGAILGGYASQGGAMRRLAPPLVFALGGAILGGLAAIGSVTVVRALGRAQNAVVLTAGAALLVLERFVLVHRYAWLHAALIIAGSGLLAIGGARRDRGEDAAAARQRPHWTIALLVAAALLLALVAPRPALRALFVTHSRIVGAVVPWLPSAKLAIDAQVVPRRALAARLAPSRAWLPTDVGRVVILTIDAWRADAFSAQATPRLWQLAQHGTCFTRAYTSTPHTSLALASLHAGRDAAAHTATAPFPATTPLLAQRFARAGWETAAFYPPAVFTIEPERTRTLELSHFGFSYVKQQFSTADERTREVRAYLDEVHPRRALIWIHYFEPHEPYDAHGDTSATTARARYDREVAFTDRAIGELLDGPLADGVPTWIVFAADHGEEFGEHGGRYHGTSLFEEQVRVPLCVARLGSTEPARNDDAPAGLVDVMPTLTAALGLGNELDGDGLVLDAASARGPAFVTLGAEIAVIDRSGDRVWKLIVSTRTGGLQLYDLRDDPTERRNVAAAEPAQVRALLAAATSYATRGNVDGPSALLLRAELGEPGAIDQLAVELPQLAPELAARGARLLVTRRRAPPVTLPGLAGRWLAVAQLTPHGPSPAWLAAECATGDAALCSEAALALADTAALVAALARRDTEEALRLRVVAALGESGDPAALDPLLLAMAEVRLRRAVVVAIDRLDDYRAIGPIARWAPHEPYADARAAMVKYLVRSARRDPSGAARAALASIAATEQEPSVRAQLGLDSASTHAK